VSIEVTPVNDSPVADPQSITAHQATPRFITLTGSDVDGDTLGYTVSNPPLHGVLSGDAPNLIYTPAAGYTGPDGFSFVVDDGLLDSVPAHVNISIYHAVFIPVITK
jgi:hypothetical protein